MMLRIDDKELIKKDLDYWEHSDAATQLPSFLEKVRAQAPSGEPRAKVITWSLSAVAAAVALFFVIRNALVTPPVPAKKKELAAATRPGDAVPGINRATLTLFDGQKIILDGAAEGAVWNKHVIIIKKTAPGIIQYACPATFHPTVSPDLSMMQYNKLETPRRGQFGITLPDGTRVWLNNASSLKFPVAFTGKKREVEITGEAFFDVAPDAHRPFSVRVPQKKMDIHVLGTSFNVSAYADDPVVRTTLVSGKVRITQRDTATLLVPQEQLIAGEHGAWQRRKNITEIPWRENRFDFDSAGLQQVMQQIARQYDKDVEIHGPVHGHVYNGLFFRSLPLDAVLKSLSGDGANFHFIIDDNNNKIIINP